MGQKKVSNQFTVNTVEDGQSAPYYFQEWYAWSNDSSTASVTTEPTIDGTWAESIPEQGSYAYLWRKSIRYVLNSGSNTYTPETAQYFRMSGTNGTSVKIKENITYAYQNGYNSFPSDYASLGDTVISNTAISSYPKNQLFRYQMVAPNVADWYPYATANDGDAFTINHGNLNGTYQSTDVLAGHLVSWSAEANKWIDLGVFRGQSGITYYTHVVWAEGVTISGGSVTAIAGYTSAKSPNDTTHVWMGTYVDRTSADPSSGSDPILLQYTWSNTKGDGAAVAHASTEQISIPCNSNGSVSSQMTVTVSFSMRIGSVAASNIRVNNPSSLPTGVQYGGTSPSTGRIIISTSATASGMASGLTFTVIGSDGTKDYTSTVTIALIGVKQGNTGERGNVGRFYYYGGVFDSSDNTKTFVVNDAQAPYFEHTENNQKRYHVYNPDTNPSGGTITMSAMWSASSGSWNNKPWEAMTNDFKYLITEALFAGFAKLGSFIISGDWMLTHYGVIYDTSGNAHTIDRNNSWTSGGTEYTPNNAYLLFDASYPNSSKPSALNFCPSFCVDGLTGETYQQKAHIKGEIEATSGTIGGFEISNTYIRSTDTNHNIQLNNDGTAKITGQIEATSGHLSNVLVGNADAAHFEFKADTGYNGEILCKDSSGATRINISFDNDEMAPLISMNTLYSSCAVSPIHFSISHVESQGSFRGTEITEDGLEIHIQYVNPTSLKYIDILFDDDEKVKFLARDSNGNHLWPDIGTPTQTPSLEIGRAYTMPLAHLYNLFNNHAYYLNWFNKVSLMVVQTTS